MIQRHVCGVLNMAALPFRQAADIDDGFDGTFFDPKSQFFHRYLRDCRKRQSCLMPRENTVFQKPSDFLEPDSRHSGARFSNTSSILRYNEQGNLRFNETPGPRGELAGESNIQRAKYV